MMYNAPGKHIKDFFKKPFTLIIALLFIIAAILPAVYYLKLAESLGDLSDAKDNLALSLGGIFSAPATMEELFSGGSLVIMITSVFAPLLIAVALIMLFVASKSTKPNVTGKTAASALIGGASLVSFGMTYTACMILFPLVDLFENMNGSKLSNELTAYVVRLIVTLSALVLYSVSFGIFTKSVYKNLFISKARGRVAACFFGISSILMGVVYMLFTIDISEVSSGYLNDAGKLLLSAFALSAVTYIATAIFAFMYSAHIKNQPDLPLAAQPAPVSTPIEPTAQPQTVNYSPVTVQPVVARTSVRQADCDTEKDTPSFCPECGSAVIEHQLFCAECGTKLK